MASIVSLGACYIQVRTGFHTGQFGGAFSQLKLSLPKWLWPLSSWRKTRERKWGGFEASRLTLLYTSRNPWTLCNTKYEYYKNNCFGILFRKKNQKKKDFTCSIWPIPPEYFRSVAGFPYEIHGSWSPDVESLLVVREDKDLRYYGN